MFRQACQIKTEQINNCEISCTTAIYNTKQCQYVFYLKFLLRNCGHLNALNFVP
jgi:hypothetical protein